jgi:protein-disulfide isomerase
LLEKFPKELKLVHKNYPLMNHRFALRAAEAALAAKEQGKFWDFHKKLYENFESLSEEKINQIAAGLGLNMEKFTHDIDSPEIRSLILRDYNDGRRIGIRGIPTVFVNGKMAERNDPADLEAMVKEELEGKN